MDRRESGADVLVERRADLRQSCGERACDLRHGSRRRVGRIARVLLLERQRQFDLMRQRRQCLCKRPSHKRIRVLRVQSRRAEVAGIERRNEALDNLADRLTRRQAGRCAAVAAQLGDGAQLAELRYDMSVLEVCARIFRVRSSTPARVRVEDRLIHGLLIDVDPAQHGDHLAVGKRPTALRTSSSVQPIEL
jgi:hypothetical protein